jgi:hypothetical protein
VSSTLTKSRIVQVLDKMILIMVQRLNATYRRLSATARMTKNLSSDKETGLDETTEPRPLQEHFSRRPGDCPWFIDG